MNSTLERPDKTQRHKGAEKQRNAAKNLLVAVFRCVSVPLCLCVLYGVSISSHALTSQAAQQVRTIDPNAIPVDKEPQHHLVFANDFVRVVDARLPPGYKSLNHTHALDNVTVTISPGSTDVQALARIGRAGFSRGGYSHTVTNSGSIELRFINVEPLRADSPVAAAFPDQPQHKLETENERVRVYRIKLAPGESLPAHRHSSGWIAVTVAGGSGPGSFLWYAAGVSNPLMASPSGLEIVEIEPK